mmetsp:Transcript_33940/g.44780  ORF Transcript_33940/g.44780 Transcript_33940/m.44780 type:complete len:151 (-) Transcript_33940:213-665(-)
MEDTSEGGQNHDFSQTDSNDSPSPENSMMDDKEGASENDEGQTNGDSSAGSEDIMQISNHMYEQLGVSMQGLLESIGEYQQEASNLMQQQEQLMTENQNLQDSLRTEAEHIFSSTQNLFHGIANVLGNSTNLGMDSLPNQKTPSELQNDE